MNAYYSDDMDAFNMDPLDFAIYGYGGFGYDTSHVAADDKQPRIVQACKDGDLETIRTLLNSTSLSDLDRKVLLNKGRRWTEVDYKMSGFTKEYEWYDLTPLATAAANGHPDLVEFLLKKGADPTLEGCPKDDVYHDALRCAQERVKDISNTRDEILNNKQSYFSPLTKLERLALSSDRSSEELAKVLIEKMCDSERCVALLELANRFWEKAPYHNSRYNSDCRRKAGYSNQCQDLQGLCRALEELPGKSLDMGNVPELRSKIAALQQDVSPTGSKKQTKSVPSKDPKKTTNEKLILEKYCGAAEPTSSKKCQADGNNNETIPEQMICGKIKSYKRSAGHGFIQATGHQDHFFRARNFFDPLCRGIHVGQKVCFRSEPVVQAGNAPEAKDVSHQKVGGPDTLDSERNNESCDSDDDESYDSEDLEDSFESGDYPSDLDPSEIDPYDMDPVDFAIYGYGGFGYDTSHVPPDDKNPLIVQACEDGDLTIVRNLLDSSSLSDIDRKVMLNKGRRWTEVDYRMSGFTKEYEWYDLTPLATAAANGHSDLVEFLLKKGSDPTLKGCPRDDVYQDALQSGQANVKEMYAIKEQVEKNQISNLSQLKRLMSYSNLSAEELAKGLFENIRNSERCVSLVEVASRFWEKAPYSSSHYSRDCRRKAGYSNRCRDMEGLCRALEELPETEIPREGLAELSSKIALIKKPASSTLSTRGTVRAAPGERGAVAGSSRNLQSNSNNKQPIPGQIICGRIKIYKPVEGYGFIRATGYRDHYFRASYFSEEDAAEGIHVGQNVYFRSEPPLHASGAMHAGKAPVAKDISRAGASS